MKTEVLFELSVAPTASVRRLAIEHFHGVVNSLPIAPSDAKKIEQIDAALDLVFSWEEHEFSSEPITVKVSGSQTHLLIEIINRSCPLLTCPPEYQSRLPDFVFKNMGRNGQVLELSLAREKPSPDYSVIKANGRQKIEIDPAAVEIRPLLSSEMELVSELFWRIYDYKYVNETIYYPERLRELLQNEHLISIGAVYEGRVIGHLGLARWNPAEPVWEAALGVTDPNYKSSGLFKILFASIMDKAHKIPMAYTFFDSVCNHDLSQRLICREGGKDMALLVGCQVAERQASLEKLGLGADAKDMYRYTLLYLVLPQCRHPFGTQVRLPLNIGEKIGFILEEQGMKWVPAPRLLQQNAGQGRYTVRAQAEQKAIHFDFVEPGFGVVRQLLVDWRDGLRDGYEYASVDIPLESANLGIVHNILCENGFFVAGFVPYRNSTELALRLQSLGPTRVAFEHIKVFSPLGQRIRDVVRLDYERNSQL